MEIIFFFLSVWTAPKGLRVLVGRASAVESPTQKWFSCWKSYIITNFCKELMGCIHEIQELYSLWIKVWKV